MKRTLSLLLAGAFALGGATPGFAAPIVPGELPATVSGSEAGAQIQEVAERRRWRHFRNERHFRNDWRPRHRAHRHWDDWDDDDDFDGAAAAAGIFGFAAGALVGSALSQGGGYYGYGGYGYGGADAACAQKYRSYDPASNTYLGYDGYRHPCVLP
jgi:hypothetical protein